MEFERVLIETLEGDLENDACGVLSDCRSEECACYLLGRDGRPIGVRQRDLGRWTFSIYVESEGWVTDQGSFGSIEEAVFANQEYLEQLGCRAR